jgi:hypothetical protein
MLLANSGGPPLAGIIVNRSCTGPDLAVNVDAGTSLIAAARASGLLGHSGRDRQRRRPAGAPADGRDRIHDPNMSDGREADPRSDPRA